jgi:hypothetical protein
METQKVEQPGVVGKDTSAPNAIERISKNKKEKNKTLKSILGDYVSFSKFDPITGDKVASSKSDKDEGIKRALANMEMSSDARKGRTSPNSVEETLKDAATGGSLSFLTASSLLKSTKMKGVAGLAGAIGAGALSAKKQLSEYNKQQGARENIVGRKTNRSEAYSKMINKKYDT